MDVGDHGAHVTRRVARFLALLHELQDRRIPLQGIPLVAGEDLLPARRVHDHLGHVQELTQGGVERKALHAGAIGDHKFRGRAVHAVSGHNNVRAGPQDVNLGCRLAGGRRAPVHREDGTNAHVAIDVRGAVEGVEGDAEGPTLLGVVDDDWLLFFLAHEEAADATVFEAIHPDSVRDDIEFLHVVAGGILLASEPVQVARARLLNGVRADLACVLNGVHQHRELPVPLRAADDVLRESHGAHAVLEQVVLRADENRSHHRWSDRSGRHGVKTGAALTATTTEAGCGPFARLGDT
mmetsp:Transcript_94583/g.267037  ORF Transcript_94583/g.267037 Transcript_94583/m.267037 type:complete len:295 (-) Transcript_94583:6-890(-)